MTALSLAAPLVLFGLLYMLAVAPARHAAVAELAHAQALRAALARTQAAPRNAPPAPVAVPPVIEVRTPGDVAQVVTRLAESPATAGVENVAAEISGATVLLNFDARYARIHELFSKLGALNGHVEVRSVEITPAHAQLMHVRAVLAVPGPAQAPAREPEKRLAADHEKGSGAFFPPAQTKRHPTPFRASVGPAGPDPVVHTILFSSQQKAALVDVLIVRAGDRVGWGTVRSIEPDAVVLVSDSGHVKRLALEQPHVGATKR
jgi:hypothetical protein